MGYLLTIFITLVSLFCTRKIPSLMVRIALITIATFIGAYVSYWLPAWLEPQDSAQYGAWELIGVGFYFTAGIAAGILAFIFWKLGLLSKIFFTKK